MNNLRKETSPYLLQHANNPVDWYPWGQEALDKAKRENKLILVSIGYSACHWCHVMEHECFEDNEVAEVMNALYVNIKVDREERPDIDQVYMSALQLMNGTGGWPLNCILLPDGRPVYGGTYFKKIDWINILSNVAAMHRNKPQELIDYADKLIDGVRKMEFISEKSDVNEIPSNYFEEYMQKWMRLLDLENGGTQGAPKFPVPANIDFLMAYQHFNPNDVLDYAIQNTLHRIARGGIYDQVGGGIYRYSVDGVWKIPHFEKMLYDQAQMIILYANAYSKYKTPLYLQTMKSLIDFCNRELLNKETNSYYSALDADSEGVEGKFYCYTIAELKDLLGDDAPLFIEYFQCEEEGNFEHGLNNLFAVSNHQEFIQKYQLNEQLWSDRIDHCLAILFNYRESRVRPGLDDKQLCAWNALMIQGLCDAYKSTSELAYKEQAIASMSFILSNLLNGDQLSRSFKNNESKVNGFLDDYAFVIKACLSLHEITADDQYLTTAKRLTDYCLVEYFDEASGMFWYTSASAEPLVARKQEYYDSVIPSSNSYMQFILKQISTLLDIPHYEELSNRMMHTILDHAKRYPPSFSVWTKFLLMHTIGGVEVVITGANAESVYKEMANQYIPQALFSFSAKANNNALHLNRFIENKTNIYVCKNKACMLPVESVTEALKQMH